MAKLLNLFPSRRRRMEQELDRELRYHVERRVDDLMRAGLSDSEARRRAALEIGGVTQVREAVRETWLVRWLDDLGRDLRYAGRMFVRGPVFAVTAMLSLALGIGANAAIFSLVDRVLLRSLAVDDPGRLVHLDWKGNSLSSSWGTGNLVSYPLCRDLDEQRELFAGVFCRHPTEVHLSTGQQHDPVDAEIVSGSYFPVLGVRPEQGRLIDRSDDRQPGAHPMVVLSYSYWKTQLASAPDIVGRTVLVNNHPMTVIGIAPASFRGVDPLAVPAVWIPAMMKRQSTLEWDRLLDRRAVWMHAFARLEPGVTVERAKAGLQPWFTSVLDAEMRAPGFPTATADERRDFLASTIEVLPGGHGLSNLRGVLRQPLWVLFGGTLLLLLLAALNVASLLLARGAMRARELTTRMALGASRGRITRQLLVESLLITVAGGWLGLLAAPAVSRVLLSFLSQEIDLDARIDLRILLFALLIGAMTAILCGLAPAVQAGRAGRSLVASIKQSNVGAGGAVRVRKAMVIAQMAFTLILLIGAGLFVQTLARLYAKDRGYASSRLLTFRLEPDGIGYSPADAARLMLDVRGRLQAVPGVERVSVANTSLLTGGSPRRVLTIQSDRRIVTDRALPIMRVGPGFFSTLGTAVVAGRDFTEDDTRDLENGYRSIIVNESFARRYFGDRSPIGSRVGVGNRPDTKATIEIVGVIRDFSFRFLRDDREPEHAFFPFAESGPLAGNGTFYVKVRGEPESAFGSIRAAVAEIDPRLPLPLRTLDEQIDRALSSERMLATLSSAFGATALLLAVVGLYGVMSFMVTRRTQEIGLRLALGATRANAMWLIMRDASILVGAGIALAIPSAWALRRLVEAALFGVRAFDGPTVSLAIGLLALVALGAAMIPAWRAASVSPIDALRAE